MTTPLPGADDGTVVDLDRFFAEVAVERSRLDAGLRAARDRLAAAELRWQQEQDAIQAELAALAAAANDEVSHLEEVNRSAVAAIEAKASEEAAAILDAARASSPDWPTTHAGPAEMNR